MVHRIRRFDPFTTARALAIVYGIVGLVFSPIFILASMVAPEQAGFGIGFAVVIPVVYAVMGFIMTLVGCWLYNVVAGWVGGIEMELD